MLGASGDEAVDYPLPIAPILPLLYTLFTAISIILGNRSPQSTFAWLLLFIVVPVVGIIVYRFLGNGWHAFSKEKELTRRAPRQRPPGIVSEQTPPAKPAQR